MKSNALAKDANYFEETPVWLKKRSSCWNDYIKWDVEASVELFAGLVYMMASPDEWHQWVAGDIYGQLRELLKGRKCTPYIAPVDVRLFPQADGSDNVVFQPDVFVVCDPDKFFNRTYCHGAPDFVIEVMSKSSAGKDLVDKKNWYEKAGVQEYWVVSYDKLYAYMLIDVRYAEEIRHIADISDVPVKSLGCTLNFEAMKERYKSINAEVIYTPQPADN